MTPPPCPRCRRPIARMQRSAPKGSPAAAGPVAAYPCGCWLTVQQASHIAITNGTNGNERGDR